MRNKFPVYATILAISFIILTVLVQLGIFNGLDLSITRLSQNIIPRSFDLPFSVFSLIGKVEIVGITLLLLVAMVKGLNKLLVLFLFGLDILIEYLIKLFVVQNPPPIEFLRTVNLFGVPTDRLPHGTYAYPSGHAARIAFLSALAFYVIWENENMSRGLKYILTGGVILFDFIMFGSRIYLGEHWTTDVIGGVILGLGLFLIGIYFSRRLSN